MKKSLLLMIVFLLSVSTSASYADDTAWDLKRDKHGVKVFTRAKQDSVLKEFKGTVVVNAKLSVVVATLQDVVNYPLWMPNIDSINLLNANETSHMHYVKSDLPWPVSDRDGIYHFIYKTLDNGAIRADVTAKPQAIAPVKRTIRIPSVAGFWLFEPVSKQSVTVTYQMHADPGGSLPSWLINSSVVDSPHKTLLNLKSYVETQ